MTLRRVLITVVAVLSIPCGDRLLAMSHPKVVYLYSWQTDNRDYAFVLVPKSENEKFLSGFNRNVPHILGISNLEAQLAKLPRGSGFAWRDEKHIGLIFPPEKIRNQIAKAAASYGVIVEIAPTIYD